MAKSVEKYRRKAPNIEKVPFRHGTRFGLPSPGHESQREREGFYAFARTKKGLFAQRQDNTASPVNSSGPMALLQQTLRAVARPFYFELHYGPHPSRH